MPHWQAPLRLALLRREPGVAEPMNKDAATRRAVEFTASDILDFLESGLQAPGDAGERKTARPGDVAVIVRTHKQEASCRS